LKLPAFRLAAFPKVTIMSLRAYNHYQHFGAGTYSLLSFNQNPTDMTPQQQRMEEMLFQITLRLEYTIREQAEELLQDFEMKFSTRGYQREFEEIIQEQRLWKMQQLENLRTKIYAKLKQAPTLTVAA